MARSLYRFYLYSVVIILLIALTIITSIALSSVLSVVLAESPYARPSQSNVVQTVALAAAMWIVTILVGGLHYWLIRRDMLTDPKAGGSPIRTFYLNLPSAIAAITAVWAGAAALSNIGAYWDSVASPLATAISAAGLFLLLQLEQSRSEPAPGAAIVFQRLHLYFTRLIIVFIGTTFWLNAISLTLQALSVRAGYLNPCAGLGFPTMADCGFPQQLTLIHVAGVWIAAAWCLGGWIFYGYLVRTDRPSVLSQVALLLGLAYAAFITIMGLEDGLETLARAVLHRTVTPQDVIGQFHQFGYPQALSFGLLLLAAYWRIYTASTRQLGDGTHAAALVRQAVLAIVPAIPFWVGVNLVLAQFFEHISPDPRPGYAFATPHALAVVLAGAIYIPIALYFRARTRAEGISWPRRAYVLALLAGGIVTAAISLVILAQALITSALGSPIGDWQQHARSASAALLVGLALCTIYGIQAVRERYLTMSSAPETLPEGVEAVPTPAQESIETILDRLLAGDLSRDQAAERLRQVSSHQ